MTDETPKTIGLSRPTMPDPIARRMPEPLGSVVFRAVCSCGHVLTLSSLGWTDCPRCRRTFRISAHIEEMT